jgi:hypothetical protein
MKSTITTILIGLTLCVPVRASAQSAKVQSTRQYYNELYKAGGLDHLAARYVCFDDDDKLETFFIFGESKHIREFMIADGSFGKLSRELQRKLEKDFLIVRGYDKGVAVGGEEYLGADASSWVDDIVVLSKQPEVLSRIRLSVTWETLRYRRSVEVLNPDTSFRDELSRYGKCERVSPEIPQHGKP